MYFKFYNFVHIRNLFVKPSAIWIEKCSIFDEIKFKNIIVILWNAVDLLMIFRCWSLNMLNRQLVDIQIQGKTNLK